MRKLVLFACFIIFTKVSAKEKGNFYGGFESNSQWHLNDSQLKDEFNVSVS